MKKVSQAVIYGKFFDFPCSQMFLNAYKALPRTYVITIDQKPNPHQIKPFLDLLRAMKDFEILDYIKYEDLDEWDYHTIMVDVLDCCSFEQMIRWIASGRPYVHIWHPYATFDIAKGKAGTYDEA